MVIDNIMSVEIAMFSQPVHLNDLAWFVSF